MVRTNRRGSGFSSFPVQLVGESGTAQRGIPRSVECTLPAGYSPAFFNRARRRNIERSGNAHTHLWSGSLTVKPKASKRSTDRVRSCMEHLETRPCSCGATVGIAIYRYRRGWAYHGLLRGDFDEEFEVAPKISGKNGRRSRGESVGHGFCRGDPRPLRTFWGPGSPKSLRGRPGLVEASGAGFRIRSTGEAAYADSFF